MKATEQYFPVVCLLHYRVGLGFETAYPMVHDLQRL